MTISNQEATITYTGNGSLTAFNYPFEIPYQADAVTPAVTVTKTNNLTMPPTVTVLVLGTDYSISDVGNPSGGNVTYPLSGSALPATSTLRIDRSLEYVQPYQFLNQGFYPATVEQLGDFIEMQIQQLNARLARLGG